jgi:hypothetical protein
MNRCLALISLVALLVCGCAPVRPTIHLNSQFDAQEAQRLLARGSNTITGSALIRQQGGGIVTCAGNEVFLIPVTTYATERMQHIYNSDQEGFSPVLKGAVMFEPEYPDYWSSTRKVTADAQGYFEFTDVADGEFYVVTAITWKAGSVPQGGALMQRVTLSGGEAKKIVLSP